MQKSLRRKKNPPKIWMKDTTKLMDNVLAITFLHENSNHSVCGVCVCACITGIPVVVTHCKLNNYLSWTN